jgi:hypothetical protein
MHSAGQRPEPWEERRPFTPVKGENRRIKNHPESRAEALLFFFGGTLSAYDAALAFRLDIQHNYLF